MEVLKIRLDAHLADILELLHARGAYIPSLREFPEHGYIAYQNDEPVAAAFLRRVEGGFGQIDGLVSSPEFSSEDRHLAIEAVVSAVIEEAKKLEIRQLISFSVDESTLMRSRKHGFKRMPHHLVVANIGNSQGHR